MFRRLFHRLLAIMLVALALETLRRVRMILHEVRRLESIVRSRESERRTHPLQEVD